MIDAETQVRGKAGSRAECLACHQTRRMYAAGQCSTCYRFRNGRDAACAVCIDCGRLMVIVATGRCATCHRHHVHPERRYRHSPRPPDFTEYTYMFDRPAPAKRLNRHERAAFADVHRIWSGRPAPRAKQTGPRGKGRGRRCVDCDQLGARLHNGNRCGPCYRVHMSDLPDVIRVLR